MMRDPFFILQNALDSIFHLESRRHGKYIYSEVRQLKHALDNYQTHNKKNFIELLKTLRKALPYVEKWHLDFNTIKPPIDYLAKQLNLPLIDWSQYLSKSNTSPKFQYSALNHAHKEIGLFAWLAAKSGAAITRKNPATHVELLLEYKSHFGFSQKLSAHLKKNPEFLFELLLHSEKNFTQIARTRLILHLTDLQLAQACLTHLPTICPNYTETSSEELVDKLNEFLSNGRSIATLMHNKEAKFILENCLFSHTTEKEDKEDEHYTLLNKNALPVESNGLKLVI